jgi:epoxide hydrolase 4
LAPRGPARWESAASAVSADLVREGAIQRGGIASVRQSQKEAAAKLRPLSAPTLVLWGERDSCLGSELAEPHREDVPNLDRVERLDASHWVHHNQAQRVNQLLIDFFA